jgi:hypothetical protein
LGTESSYVLPNIEDEEELPIKISPQLPLPTYAEYDSATKTFKFTPSKTKELGK